MYSYFSLLIIFFLAGKKAARCNICNTFFSQKVEAKLPWVSVIFSLYFSNTNLHQVFREMNLKITSSTHTWCLVRLCDLILLESSQWPSDCIVMLKNVENMVSAAVQVPVVTGLPNSWKNKQTMNIFKYFSWSFKNLYKKNKRQKEIVNFLISSYYKICFLTFLDTWNQVLGAVYLFSEAICIVVVIAECGEDHIQWLLYR